MTTPKTATLNPAVARYVNIDLSAAEETTMNFLRKRLGTKSRVAIYRQALKRMEVAERKAQAKESRDLTRAKAPLTIGRG